MNYFGLGSPPQVRGKPKNHPIPMERRRITPAGAGKTIIYHRMHSESRDHPRRCGENQMLTTAATVSTGSPPQVRGKQNVLTHHRHGGRITPAGAGKTTRISRHISSARDHPRRCGENVRPAKKPFLTSGSPPQVRGKLHADTTQRIKARITPAGAGKTRLGGGGF